MEFLLAGVAIMLSYLSIYQPIFLSRNIKPLHSIKAKPGLFIGLVVVSIGWIWFGFYVLGTSIPLLSIHLMLIQIAVIDGCYNIIPNRLVSVLLIFAIYIIFDTDEGMDWFFVGIFNLGLIGVQLTAKQLLNKKIMGWGDVKLLLVLSLIYQQEILIILIGGILIGGLYSIILILINPENRTKQVPLSPFFVVIIPFVSGISFLLEGF